MLCDNVSGAIGCICPIGLSIVLMSLPTPPPLMPFVLLQLLCVVMVCANPLPPIDALVTKLLLLQLLLFCDVIIGALGVVWVLTKLLLLTLFINWCDVTIMWSLFGLRSIAAQLTLTCSCCCCWCRWWFGVKIGDVATRPWLGACVKYFVVVLLWFTRCCCCCCCCCCRATMCSVGIGTRVLHKSPFSKIVVVFVMAAAAAVGNFATVLTAATGWWMPAATACNDVGQKRFGDNTCGALATVSCGAGLRLATVDEMVTPCWMWN